MNAKYFKVKITCPNYAEVRMACFNLTRNGSILKEVF